MCICIIQYFRLRVLPTWARFFTPLNKWVFGKVVTEMKHSIKAHTPYSVVWTGGRGFNLLDSGAPFYEV